MSQFELGADTAGTSRAEHHGGMFLDVGCAQLIIDGKVRVKRGEVKEAKQEAVVFSDGSMEDADVLVFACVRP